jgi:hypothetical protein
MLGRLPFSKGSQSFQKGSHTDLHVLFLVRLCLGILLGLKDICLCIRISLDISSL